jgi:CTD small phosphatase-like protein 2
LPKIRPDRLYTLVLDLDETLIHYEERGDKGEFLIRPYAQEFIDELAKFYEITVFTASVKEYADWILDRLDTNGSVTHRLYREHTTLLTNGYTKDLTELGRNLKKTLIVDNNPENFKFQPHNGVYIKSWFQDPSDRALKDLCPLLRGNLL